LEAVTSAAVFLVVLVLLRELGRRDLHGLLALAGRRHGS
jgi:hypothetical protein